MGMLFRKKKYCFDEKEINFSFELIVFNFFLITIFTLKLN